MNLLCVRDARKVKLDGENRSKILAWRKRNNLAWKGQNGANKEAQKKKKHAQHECLASDRATTEQKQEALERMLRMKTKENLNQQKGQCSRDLEEEVTRH